MVSFWFKKKKIVLECFTDQATVHKLFPIERTRHFTPEWFKKLPLTHKSNKEMSQNLSIEEPSIRMCPAINDHFSYGAIMPAFAELIIQRDATTGKAECMAAAATWGQPVQHHADDLANKGDLLHWKFGTPWLFREDTGIKFYWTQPSWHQRNPLNHWITPGFIEFKYQHSVLVNMMIPKGKRIHWNAGDPVVQLIPLIDDQNSFEVKCHLVDSSEMEKLTIYKPFFLNSYMKLRKLKKDMEKGK